ncbi:MAG: type II secretion system protein [Deltaproteobacteria bacterium]|nr:MAG: type II secretion system protein [Deltaproteobacteria bacterium]
MSLPLFIALIVFLLVFSITMCGYMYLEEKYWRTIVARRLLGNTAAAGTMIHRLRTPWMRAAQALGKSAVPRDKAALSKIERKLGYAGFRQPHAVQVFFGLRILLMLVLGGFFLLGALLTGTFQLKTMIMMFLPLAVGYYLPAWLLRIRMVSRQKQIFRELPDGLDLVLICLEAGLNFDNALYRVSRELTKVSPVLAEEFSQYFLEIQSGLPRKTVLHNLAERNGVESLTAVVAVVLQSLRFGTNIAEALKVHINSMRTRRRQNAEEAGAKISTRLTFPLVMLILPALFIIIIGPAMINVFERVKGGL